MNSEKRSQINMSITAFLKDALYNYDLPGLSVGIQSKDDEAIILSFGYSNYEKKTPLTKEHIFHMASITKLFTGSSVLKLANEGIVSLDAPLVSLMPYFSMKENKNLDFSYKTITPRQILSHTSGLPDVTNYHWELKEHEKNSLYNYCTSLDVKNRTLLWSPLENRFSYSNIGYELLGLLVQETSGLSFEEYVYNNFFKPLAMDQSTLKTYERTPNYSLEINDLEKVGMVIPYDKDTQNHIVKVPYFPYHRGHGPSSTLTAPIIDILKWGQAFFGPCPIIKDAFGKENPWDPIAPISQSTESIGLSWFIRKEKENYFYGHEGSDDGFRSSFWVCPQKKLAVVVCANLSKAPVKKINKKIFQILLNS